MIIAIDEKDTVIRDDAASFERFKDGYIGKLYVPVTALSREDICGSFLEIVSYRQALFSGWRSDYSLDVGVFRECLEILFYFDSLGILKSYEVSLKTIQVDVVYARCSLPEDPMFGFSYCFTKSKSLGLGGVSSDARLVERLILLSRTILAKWAQENLIPVIYRFDKQSVRDFISGEGRIVSRFVRGVEKSDKDNFRRYLKDCIDRRRSYPLLGSFDGDFQLCATTPLRKIIDLVNCIQIRQFLRGDSFYYNNHDLACIALFNAIASIRNAQIYEYMITYFSNAQHFLHPSYVMQLQGSIYEYIQIIYDATR